MYCFYFVNTFSQEKLNIQQIEILYMSKDQWISFLKQAAKSLEINNEHGDCI